MIRTIAFAMILISAAMAASEPLQAQARGPAREVRSRQVLAEEPPPLLDEASRNRMFREAQAWLRRLIGQFEVDQKEVTAAGTKRLYGTAECSHIGDGSGVQCKIQMLGTESDPQFENYSREHNVRTPIKKSTLLLFFGINAKTMEIQLILADLELVTARSGLLVGDAVRFLDNWNVCYREWTHCWMAADITAPPAGEVVMKFSADHYGNIRRHPLTTKSGHTVDMELRLRSVRDVDTSGIDVAH